MSLRHMELLKVKENQMTLVRSVVPYAHVVPLEGYIINDLHPPPILFCSQQIATAIRETCLNKL